MERFTRLTGEAVQVQTVIPVRPSDQWKSVRSEMCHSKLERPVQMLKQRLFGSLFAVKRHWLTQDLIITRFFDVCRHCRDQPQRVIVKSTSNIRISLPGQRLVLMICTSILKLCGCNIKDPLPRPLRDQMHKSQKILTGITESHSTSRSRFIIGCRP